MFLLPLIPIFAQEAPKSSTGEFTEMERKDVFTEPGIIGIRDGKWVGSDHLFNLPRNLGVTVDVISPDGTPLPVDKEKAEKIVEPIFKEGGLSPSFTFAQSGSPLPFFNFLIMVYPVPNGYVAYIEGRLFEEVEVSRVQLAKEIYWQAVTWEKQTLIVSAQGQFRFQLQSAIESIARDFVKRYQHFQSLK